MAKNCDFITTEAASKSWMRNQGIINKYLDIKDLVKFRSKNTEWSKKVNDKFGIPGRLFVEEKIGNSIKAIPSKTMFHQIDAAKGIFYKENEYLQKDRKDVRQEQIEEARDLQREDDMRAGVPYIDHIDGLLYMQEKNLEEDHSQATSTKDNFTSYTKHLTDTLETIEHKYSSFRTLQRKNKGNDSYNKTDKAFKAEISKIRDILANTSLENAAGIYKDVIAELRYLTALMEESDLKIAGDFAVRDRIDFFSRVILGRTIDGKTVEGKWEGLGMEDYNSLLLKPMNDLKSNYINKIKDVVKNALENDIIYQNVKEKYSEEEIKSLFGPRADIHAVEKLFLGINSNDDGIGATLLSTLLHTEVQRTTQLASGYIDNLIIADKKLKDKNFSLENFIEVDKDGIGTGNIIDKYTKKYHNKISQFYSLVNSFNSAIRADKDSAYKNQIGWLEENVDMVDFRKLREFKEVYGHLYGSHFTATEAEMDAYEAQLKSKLGGVYQETIRETYNKLKEFEDVKTEEEFKNTKYKDKNIASVNPWIFMDNFHSDNKYSEINYDSVYGTQLTYNTPRFTTFTPKENSVDIDTGETVDTGYYNSKFSEIEGNSDALDYWTNIRDLYRNHINPTYASMGQYISSMSYAKFERTLGEEISKSESILGKGTSAVSYAVNSYKDMWFDIEKDLTKEGVKTNYSDNTQNEIYQFSKALRIKSIADLQTTAEQQSIVYEDLDLVTAGLNVKDTQSAKDLYKEQLVDKLARKAVFDKYSTDLTKTSLALADLASLHRGRQEAAVMADMILDFHSEIETEEGKKRFKSMEKLNSYVDATIKNKRMGQKHFMDNPSKMIKRLNDNEKEISKVLKDLKKGSSSELGGYGFQGEEADISYAKTESGTYLKRRMLEGGSYANEVISEEAFEKVFQTHLDNQLGDLGIGTSLSGILSGIMGNMVVGSLAVAPQAGLFNRIEGKITNSINDASGEFWAPGNLRAARKFLVGINLSEFTEGKLSAKSKRQKAQVQTYLKFLEKLNILQDRKNELAKKEKQSSFGRIANLNLEEKMNPFAFAVNNPELKNQSEVILSMLQDVEITDMNGITRTFFDADTGEMVAYKPNTLELKDEYKFNSDGTVNEKNIGWESFTLNEEVATNNDFFVNKVKMEDAIKRIQGNYSNLDSIQLFDNRLAKMFMMFMKWLPEHANQRFGKRGIDIIQGKKESVGRYRGLARTSLGGATAASGIISTIMFGPMAIPIFGAATFAGFVSKMVYTKIKKGGSLREAALQEVQVTTGLLVEVLSRSLNMPAHILFGKLDAGNKWSKRNALLNNAKTLSEAEVRAIKGVAMDLAVSIHTLLFTMALNKVVSAMSNPDEEEDEEAWTSLLMNSANNMGQRLVETLTVWGRPHALLEENSKFALLRTVGDVERFIKAEQEAMYTDRPREDYGYLLLGKLAPVPIPNSLLKIPTKGEYPFLDHKEYVANSWNDRVAKGPEWQAQQKYNNNRKAYKKAWIDWFSEMHPELTQEMVKKAATKRMRVLDIAKDTRNGETFQQAMERIEFEKIGKFPGKLEE